MLVGVPERLEEEYSDLLSRFDVLSFASFEGPRELELKALFEVLRALDAREVKTLTLWGSEEGLIIPAWRWKSLEGPLEKVSNAIMPFYVKGKVEALVWFQAFHPGGGVPDIMLAPPPAEVRGKVIAFSGRPAWLLKDKAMPLGWEPTIVVEVKRRAKRPKEYKAKVRLLACEEVEEVEGWEVVRLSELAARLPVEELKSSPSEAFGGNDLVPALPLQGRGEDTAGEVR